MGRVPLYGVLSFPPLAYSVPDLVNSKLGLDGPGRCAQLLCAAFLNSLVYKRALRGALTLYTHARTTRHSTTLKVLFNLRFFPGVYSAQNM